MFVSETYGISDMIVYDDASTDKSSKYSYLNVSSLSFVSDHYEAVTTTNTVGLPTRFEWHMGANSRYAVYKDLKVKPL